MMIPNSIIMLGAVVLLTVAQMKYLVPDIQINREMEVCMNALNTLNNKLRPVRGHLTWPSLAIAFS